MGVGREGAREREGGRERRRADGREHLGRCSTPGGGDECKHSTSMAVCAKERDGKEERERERECVCVWGGGGVGRESLSDR